MTLHRHILAGCRPDVLAHYLKGIGIFRLIAEQKDPEIRAAWFGETWHLITKLSQEEILDFILNEFAPTPMLSPWNKGSGFYEKKPNEFDLIAKSTAPRFQPYREALNLVKSQLTQIQEADEVVRSIKGEVKQLSTAAAKKTLEKQPEYSERLKVAENRFKQLKSSLLLDCKRRWRGPLSEWLEAALVILGSSEPKYPALLGTGGCDGRMDFTRNAVKYLFAVLDLENEQAEAREGQAKLLMQALFGESEMGLSEGAKVGQFLPGNAGGANEGNAPKGKSLLNPWDFLLMLEGAAAFQASAVKRLAGGESVQASAPFAFYQHAAGHISASHAEESPRGEQWLPIWSAPMGYKEFKNFLCEGRAQLGRKAATRALDMARATSKLGVARGVESFVRFAYLERQGQSNLAIPLSRIEVQRMPHARLVDDLAVWVDRLHRESRGKNSSHRLIAAERQLADSIFGVLTQAEQPGAWQRVLINAAEIELLQLGGTAATAGPIPKLRPQWLRAADDGGPEFRLAAALALTREGPFMRRSGEAPAGSLRRHLLPLDHQGRGRPSFDLDDKRLKQKSDHVATGRDPVTDLLAITGRRLLESEQGSGRRLNLMPTWGFGAQLADLGLLLAGALDLRRILLLARALSALDSWEVKEAKQEGPRRVGSPPGGAALPSEAWMLLRVAHYPWTHEQDGFELPVDPAILRRLASGDASAAFTLARRRLQAAGWKPTLHLCAASPEQARLFGAALLFPIEHRSAQRLLARIDPSFSPIHQTKGAA